VAFVRLPRRRVRPCSERSVGQVECRVLRTYQ